ncbi:MAG: hypothetical protein ABIN48_10790 [Ginsengibacter sp.]
MKKHYPNQLIGHVQLKQFFPAKYNWRLINPQILYLLIPFFLLSITGCKKELSYNQVALEKSRSQKTQATFPSLPAAFEAKLINLKKSTNQHPQLKKNFADYMSGLDPQYKIRVLKALNVSESTCNENTMLSHWLNNTLSNWNQNLIFYMMYTGMIDLPINYTYFFENMSANQTFGMNGEYTKILTKTFKDLKRFWNVQSDNLLLVPLHGGIMQDRGKLIKTYSVLYGMSPAEAEYYADLVIELLQYYPQYQNGNHPIFTFNAFSSNSAQYAQPIGILPPKIIMGDGILAGYSAIGFGDVAPQAILAHEYGHQIQYQLNLFPGSQTPEATRKIELMADAYSAYFLSHARGATMQWKRVKLFLQVFFNIGDCRVNSTSHHGTPTQRMAAAEWGYKVADNAQKQGHILTAEAFTKLFEAELPGILAK